MNWKNSDTNFHNEALRIVVELNRCIRIDSLVTAHGTNSSIQKYIFILQTVISFLYFFIADSKLNSIHN